MEKVNKTTTAQEATTMTKKEIKNKIFTAKQEIAKAEYKISEINNELEYEQGNLSIKQIRLEALENQLNGVGLTTNCGECGVEISGADIITGRYNKKYCSGCHAKDHFECVQCGKITHKEALIASDEGEVCARH